MSADDAVGDSSAAVGTSGAASAVPPVSPVALALSERCVALLLERGTSRGVSSLDLAHAAGISLRTFHRYLGGPASCVRPVLHAAIAAMARALRERPADEPLPRALDAAFSSVASGDALERTLRLIPLLTETAAMRAVWGRSLHDGEGALEQPLAERMRLPSASPRAAVLATVTMALVRRALVDAAETGSDPAPIFREYLAALDAGPLAVPAVSG